MAAATDSRQFVSIIDSEKIKKFQNLNNNNNPVSGAWAGDASRRPRNDSINCPAGLFLPLNDMNIHNGLEWLLKEDCMWTTGNLFSDGDLTSLIDSFDRPEDENSTPTFTASTGASRQAEAKSGAESAPTMVHSAASNSMPPSPSPSSTCASVESETASQALSILDDFEPVVHDNYVDSLDVAQLNLIFSASTPAKRSVLWNDEVNPDVKPRTIVRTKSAQGSFAGSRRVACVTKTDVPRTFDESEVKCISVPPRTTLKRPLSYADEQPANKMRRTVAASAARLGCAVSQMIDCEVVIREDEHEAVEHVAVEYEVDTEEPAQVREFAPRRFVCARGVPSRAQPIQRPRPNMQLMRCAKPQRTMVTMTNPTRPTFSASLNARARTSFHQVTIPGRPLPALNRTSFAGRLQSASAAQDTMAYTNRLLGRPTKRFSLPPTTLCNSGPASDTESVVSMSANRRGSSSYCSQMERNRRREMNTALAALRRLILEDDRSLLSKVYAENQINRRNTSMIMTLRAAHDAVLKLNDVTRRTHEERVEQLRRRERLHKRLQQLQTACQ